MKVNYRYKINWELGALIKLIIKEAMHIIRGDCEKKSVNKILL